MSIWDSIYEGLGMVSIMESLRGEKENNSDEDSSQQYSPDQIAPKKYSFRPRTLDEYVGQNRPKELLKINLQKIKNIKPVHFIISGAKGTGKSTLAYIISNLLDFKIHTYIGGAFTLENLQKFLVENEESEGLNILFIDEIHGLEKTVGEFMYPLLEDFLLPTGNVKVRPFIFIGCTTDLHILQKKLAPMIDRCQPINLEHYNAGDIKKIIKQYNKMVYQEKIDEEIYDILSVNSRYTPRLTLSLFDDYIICKDVKKILDAHQIVKNSLTINDILVLEHLAEIDKPIGVEVLAIITQQTKQDYQLLQEPFLIMEKYISRTSRGRIITNKGKQLLAEIQKKEMKK